MKTILTVVLTIAGLVGGGIVLRIMVQQPERETRQTLRLYNQELPDTGHAQRLVP